MTIDEYLAEVSKLMDIPQEELGVMHGYDDVLIVDTSDLPIDDFEEQVPIRVVRRRARTVPHYGESRYFYDTLLSFYLYSFPGCCAFAILSELGTKNHKLHTLTIKFAEAIAAANNYSALIRTDIMTNRDVRRTIGKSTKWKEIHRVKNRRTGNNVFIAVKNL